MYALAARLEHRAEPCAHFRGAPLDGGMLFGPQPNPRGGKASKHSHFVGCLSVRRKKLLAVRVAPQPSAARGLSVAQPAAMVKERDTRSAYERERDERVAANNARMRALGVKARRAACGAALSASRRGYQTRIWVDVIAGWLYATLGRAARRTARRQVLFPSGSSMADAPLSSPRAR